MATPPIRPPANQNQINATTLQRQSRDATKEGLILASNRPGDALRADVLANDPTQNSGLASLENFTPKNGSRDKPLVLRYPQEIGSPKSDMPHVMQFKIYWRWEDTNLKKAGEKLKGESMHTLKGMQDDLNTLNLNEGGYAASDALINTASAQATNDMFLTRKASGAASFEALFGMFGAGSAAGAASAAMSANNNAAERAESKKSMERNVNNQTDTVNRISSNLGTPTEKFGATKLSQDSTVLGGRINKVIGGDLATPLQSIPAGKLKDALSQKDPSYDQMVSVYLPICSRINGDDAFSYDDADMAKITGTVAGLNAAVGGAAGSLAGQALLGAFLAQGGGYANAATAVSGMVLNPRIEKLFKQKDIRNFSFSWDFYPRNQDEVNTIKDIIETFRYHSSPSKYSGTENANDPQIVLRVPAEFTIKFISSTPNGFAENEHIPKISRCVITGIGVDYTPTGIFSTLPDNSPVAYTLTLSFSEMTQLTREDIGAGY